jgi:zinc protease
MAIVSLRSLSAEEYLEPVTSLLADVVARPSFPADSLEREKARSLQSLDFSLQKPATVGMRKLYEALYPGHPYANHPQGTHESLKSIRREDLVAFYERYYVAKNLVIAIVGDLDLEQAKKLSEKISGKLPTGKKATALASPAAVKAGTYRIDFPSSQSHIITGYRGISRDDPRYLALKVGNYSLGGGGFQSRLMKEIRDKRGLTYGAYSYFLPMMQNGPFIASLSTRNDQVDEAYRVNNSVIDEFVITGPTAKELEMAKKNITGGFPLTIDSNKKLVSTLAAIAFYDLPLDYLDTYIDRVNALTLEEIRDAIKSALGSQKPVSVIVGKGQQ